MPKKNSSNDFAELLTVNMPSFCLFYSSSGLERDLITDRGTDIAHSIDSALLI